MPEETLTKRMTSSGSPSLPILMALVICWWSISTASAVHSKKFVASQKDNIGLKASFTSQEGIVGLRAALILTFGQMSVGFLLSFVILQFRFSISSNENTTARSTAVSKNEIQRRWFTKTLSTCFLAGLTYTASCMTTNYSLTFVTLTVTQALKAMEPFFTATLLSVINPEMIKYFTFWRVSGLSLIIGGIVIGLPAPLLTAGAISVASATNLLHAGTYVQVKEIQRSTLSSSSQIYCCSCFVGACVTITLIMSDILLSIFQSKEISGYHVENYESFLISSIGYAAYTSLSFAVLGALPSPVHGLLKAGKRLVLVIAGAAWVGEGMSPRIWCGVGVAAMGTLLYKYKDEKNPDSSSIEEKTSDIQKLQGGESKNDDQTSGVGKVVGLSKGKRPLLVLKILLFLSFVNLLVWTSTSWNSINEDLEPTDRIGHSLESPISSTKKDLESVRPDIQSSPSNKNDPSDAVKWLNCIKAVRAYTWEKLQDVFSESQYHTGPVVLIDPAHHDNVGDNLIAMGERNIATLFGWRQDQTLECYVHQSWQAVGPCSFHYSRGAKLAMYTGGGNWGDLYNTLQVRRIKAIEQALSAGVTVVSMPQSLFYKTESKMHSHAAMLESIVKSNPNAKLILTWRQLDSFEKAKKIYPFVDNRLIPDMAFHVGPPLRHFGHFPGKRMTKPETVDIHFLLRKDKESVLQNPNLTTTIIDTILRAHKDKTGRNVTYLIKDWAFRNDYYDEPEVHRQPPFDYAARLESAASMMSSSRVIVSDRLHASILAFISFKPHVMIDQSYGKIEHTRAVAFNVSEDCRDAEALRYAKVKDLEEGVHKALVFLEKYGL